MRAGTAVQKEVSESAEKARRRFLRFFPKGFNDDKYFAWERDYKWRAHERWGELLARPTFRRLLNEREYAEISARALKSLSGTNLLFSFESMALRDAVKTPIGAKRFATGLFEFLHGRGDLSKRFDDWCEVIASLPRRQSRVLTHPIATVFGFLAQPQTHIYFKPTATRTAASRYGFELEYASRPSWATYKSVLELASVVATDLASLGPRDMIDIQSFLWVIGSEEYDHLS